VRPTVQGVAVVLENRTGRVLAMARRLLLSTQSTQPRDAGPAPTRLLVKPMTYLAALNSGLQPNTLVDDAPITYPPIGGTNRYTRDTDYWSPHNYDGGYSGTMTIRRALEMSKNLPTARLLDGGIAGEPARASTKSAGSRSKRASFRSASGIIPSCSRPSRCGRSIWRRSMPRSPTRESARPACDRIDHARRPRSLQSRRESQAARHGRSRAVFQMRTFLQGVVARGTAARLSSLSPYLGGKTGTSDDFKRRLVSSVSATTSPSRSGWATTMPRASARSAAARPAQRWRSRFSSRS